MVAFQRVGATLAGVNGQADSARLLGQHVGGAGLGRNGRFVVWSRTSSRPRISPRPRTSPTIRDGAEHLKPL